MEMGKVGLSIGLAYMVLTVFPACSSMEDGGMTMGTPAVGDTASVEGVIPIESVRVASQDKAPEAKKAVRAKRRAVKPAPKVEPQAPAPEPMTVVQAQPLEMPPMAAPSAEELNPKAPVEASTGISGFLRRYLLVLIGALTLGGVAIYSLHVHPRRRSDTNRFG